MPKLALRFCLVITVVLFLLVLFFPRSIATAASDKSLTLYCVDVGKSYWTKTSTENHLLIAPEPATGNELLNGVHTEVIDLSTKRAFLDQADPNHPVEDSHIGPLTAAIADVAISITNSVPPNTPAATFVKVTIDRRTGLYFQTNQLLDQSNHVESTMQYVRVCSTGKPKF